MEFVWFDPQVAVRIRLQVGGCLRRVLSGNAAWAFAVVWGEGGDVHQAGDIGQIAHLGYYRAAIGVTNQQDLAGNRRDHFACAFGIIGQRGQGHFHCMQVAVTQARQFKNDFAPVGGAAPEAVDQDNARFFAHGGCPADEGGIGSVDASVCG
ncbi:hypothetical protein D3C75_1041760 [compost metagenome]